MTRGMLTRAMVLLLVATSAVAATDEVSHSRRETMNIRMTMAGQIITASLEESDSARDFFAMLPLTLPLEDYAETEKIAYLPRKLTTQTAPEGIDPQVGDIAYYAPGATWLSTTGTSVTRAASSAWGALHRVWMP